ncbi:MAG TPA: LLM class F420-dependent oxidoreductase [Actinomycetota bacterium]|nr:LLM class F420-dependent oxidoreductase [Actinomycetota bacterium]
MTDRVPSDVADRPREPVTRFGLQIPTFTYPGVPDAELFERVAAIATTAEQAGFDSLWVMDHLYQIRTVGPPTDPMLESYTLLGALAARTERARLGALVTGVTYRNPALLAKIVTTLDVISSGRAILGIGAAWNEDEHAGYGFDFPPPGERLDRLEEALRICRAMFTEEAPTVAGRHARIQGALNRPRPVTPGGPPILVGGGGERRTLRLVARYADACNLFGDVATIRRKLEVLDRHCQEVGRDPAEISRTRLGTLVISPTAGEAARRAEQLRVAMGVDEATFGAMVVAGDPDAVAEQVAAYLDAGLDGLMFNMPGAETLEPVALAGETLVKHFGPGGTARR